MEQAKPLCEYYKKCGGCTAQHIAYETQLENKKKWIINELKNNSIDFKGEVKVFGSEPYHYRNRMDFLFMGGGLGLRRKEEFENILPIYKCVISNEKINTLLDEVWAWVQENQKDLHASQISKYFGDFKYAVIRSSEFMESSTVVFVLKDYAPNRKRHIEMIKKYKDVTTANNLVVVSIPEPDEEGEEVINEPIECFALKGLVDMKEKILGNRIAFNSNSFFQNNSKVAEKMVLHTKEILQKYETKNAILADLYGGAGTFGICLRELFAKTFIIDNEPLNITAAQKNIKLMKYQNVEAMCKDPGAISNLKHSNKPFFLISDPPRSGMEKKVIDRILLTKPDVMIYVSCNPSKLASDLRKFQKHYALESVAFFDLFPQTPHIEVIAELK